MLGAGGGGGSPGGNGGGGACVKLQISNPTLNSQFALYPGSSKNGVILGGRMSMVFSISGTTYTCMAIAAGGGGAGGANGGGGGNAGVGGGGNPGLNGIGGYGDGNSGQNFSSIANPPIFSTFTFPNAPVGGAGAVSANGVVGAGGDGYGGGGADDLSLGGGGGGIYCFSNNTTYLSTIYFGNSPAAGSTIGTYGIGGSSGAAGYPGVIIVDITYYATQSLYNLIPNTNQTLGTSTNPWSSMFTSTLTVNGANKTFIIDHPLNFNKYLIHGCLEGPEVGVYYRGKSQIESTQNTIHLPRYVSDLAHDFTINITPIYNGKIRNLNCSELINNSFTVYGEPGTFHWSVYGKRGDIEVEPYKDSVVVKGDGPYKYLTM